MCQFLKNHIKILLFAPPSISEEIVKTVSGQANVVNQTFQKYVNKYVDKNTLDWELMCSSNDVCM